MKLLAAVVCVLALGAPSRADALLCNAILGCSCSVDATNLVFGSFSPLSGAAQPAVSDVTVSCTGVIDAAPLVVAKIGAGNWGTIADRQMQSAAGDRLHYNIYNTVSYATVLGDGTGGSTPLNISGGLITLGAWSVTAHMYGRATPTTSTKPGSYTDTVTVRIDW